MEYTPFRIEDAQSNRSNTFISAPEGGILNDNWCKKVSITICDDCMTLTDMDVFEESRIVRERHCAYFVSSFVTTGFLVGIFYWTWAVLRDMDEM